MGLVKFIKRHKLLPWIYAVVLLIIIGGIFLWLKLSGILAYFSSLETLEDYLNSYKSGAPLVYLVLQFLQVIVAPVPGNITTLAGSAVFGFWRGFALSFIGVLLGCCVNFALGRICGRPFVSLFMKEETIDKYLITFANKQQFMLLVFFILPFFPDDLLCLVVGITGIGWGFFLFASILGRPWGLMLSAWIGSDALSLPLWAYILGVVAGLALLVVAFRYGPKFNAYIVAKAQAWSNGKHHVGKKPHEK